MFWPPVSFGGGEWGGLASGSMLAEIRLYSSVLNTNELSPFAFSRYRLTLDHPRLFAYWPVLPTDAADIAQRGAQGVVRNVAPASAPAYVLKLTGYGAGQLTVAWINWDTVAMPATNTVKMW